MSKRVLTPQSEDFPRWYQDVVAKADLAENGPVRGTMIIKPWGYALWESVKNEVDTRIKATGHHNVAFPMFIPNSFITKEADHVEGFSPELALVTHAGGSELAEPLVVRPTSETVIGDAMSRWIQGYRDLPLLINQWANVVRWEMRPRLFLRTSEFWWQEGHTAHATKEDAQAEALMAHTTIYADVLNNHMAIASFAGLKTKRETFAGADLTWTHEGMMKDGKALQMATSHNLGQQFSKAFDITFTDESNQLRHAWTTSWGLSTRTIGALIMSHGDDNGLVLPPAMAPEQIVVIAIKEEAVDATNSIVANLRDLGLRTRADIRTEQGFGRRATEWELKGVPIRVEVGPRDLAEGKVTYAVRDLADGKKTVTLSELPNALTAELDVMQGRMKVASATRLRERTKDVETAEAVDRNYAGFYRIPWANLGEEGEATLAEDAWTVRCLVHENGQQPNSRDEDGLLAIVAKAY